MDTDTCKCTDLHCLGYHRGESYDQRIERLTAAPKTKGHYDSYPRTCQACREGIHLGVSCSEARERAAAELDYAITVAYPHPSWEEVAQWNIEFEAAREAREGSPWEF